MHRRTFLSILPATMAAASALVVQQTPSPNANAISQNSSTQRYGTASEVPPFEGTLAFTREGNSTAAGTVRKRRSRTASSIPKIG